MNKKDLQGLNTIIKDNAIISITKVKKDVRKVCINFEEGENVVITGATLTKALRNTSQYLKGDKNILKCVSGISTNESEIDVMLNDYNIILSKVDEETMGMFIFRKKTKEQSSKLIYHTIAYINRNPYILFENAENWATSYNTELTEN